MTTSIRSYIETHRERFLSELFDWIRIPSVSAQTAHREDVIRAAKYIQERLDELGAQTELLPTEGFPLVYGKIETSASAPTVVIYGHYDVQPAEPFELWHTPPFEPTVRDGKIYARGANDDKGQLYMQIKAVETLARLGELPCNVKFLIEGEEEIGSPSLEAAVKRYAHLYSGDAMLISDTSIIHLDTPSLCVGLRGLAYVEVELTGPNRDLHSGHFGGAVENPCNVLCSMIASLHDENRRIAIPGFYDEVEELTPEERLKLAERPFNREEYLRQLDMADSRGENGYTLAESASIRPTLDVNGIWGGYTGEGAKTVLPSKAHAKISMRLVPRQRHDDIAQKFKKHFESIAPPSMKVKVTTHHGGNPFLTPTDSPAYRAAAAALKECLGKEPIPTREGGSIPILALFDQELKLPIVLMGFGYETDGIHGPNEHYGLENFFRGIECIAMFHRKFAQMARP
ncbi:MAG: dipeptidase [Bacteroidia bacterium]|nr:dipeptidase [Bacteroidia bacterium]